MSALEEVVLPEGLETISNYAFKDCYGLSVLTLPSTVNVIGDYSFYGCNGIRMINMNDTLESIGNSAFYGCSGLLSLVLNDGLITLGDSAFKNCINLTAVEIPKSVVNMAENSFENCAKIVIYCYSGSKAHIISESIGYHFSLLDEHVHEYQVTTETEATCLRGGTIIKTCNICGYNYIETTAPLGHDYISEVVDGTCTESGYTVHTCSRCGHSYTDSYTSPKGHSFTEWIIDKEASVLEDGSRHRECTVCGKIEEETISKIYVDIDKNKNYGKAVFTVVNAQTLEPIPNVQLFVSTENDGENTFVTDDNGQVSVVLPVGKQSVSVYGDGYLTRNLNVTINPGVNQINKIGLSNLSTYDATITSTEMTLEEIEAAGIDTSDPSNQHVYKYELKLEFVPKVDVLSIVAYFNGDGEYLGGFSPDSEAEDEPIEPEEQGYNLHYHIVEDGNWHSWCEDIVVEKGEDVPLTYYPWREGDDYVFDGWYEDDNFTRKIYSKHIEEQTTYVYGRWIYVGEEEEPAKPMTPDKGIRVPTKDGNLTVYPVSENFYLIVRGEVTWLKEMFDVEMLVVNNSMTDTLEDLTATLELPDGLSLAKMKDGEQTLSKSIENIPEGGSESVHWYVRGDEEGSYGLKAHLQGKIMPFDEPIDDVFVSENQIQVWAGDAMHLNFEFPNAAYYADDYPITITLTNVSNKTIYNISHRVDIIQGMEIYYSDDSSKVKIEPSSWSPIGVKAFHPGDKIIFKTSVNIFFESEMIKKDLEKWIGLVDDIEQFLNSMDAVEAGLNAAEKFVNVIDNCSASIDDFFESSIASSIDQEKLELFRELYGELGNFSASYMTTGNDKLDAAINFFNSGLDVSLNAIIEDPATWLKTKEVEDINKLLGSVKTFTKAIIDKVRPSEKFNIFDSIRNLISAIPIQFTLLNVAMTEDDGNTTRIPWSYTITETPVHYFGISNISKYLMSLLQKTLGDELVSSIPYYPMLSPFLDDPINTDDAYAYIKATENEIAQFKAKDATGNVNFKAYIVPNNQNEKRLLSAPLVSSSESFIMTCDNETSSYVNGVLTFTGDGTISVTPLNMVGGTLYIEDSEGNTYTYVIDVVEQHECSAGDMEVVIPPTEEYDGFAVKRCRVCQDILEVIPLNFDDCCTEHTYGDWVVEVEATCKNMGLMSRVCSVCGLTETKFIDMKEHTLGMWDIVTEPTCTEEGLEKSICSVCGEEVTRPIGKVPHEEGEWIIKKEASAFEEGVKELHCSICEEVIKTESIPMTEETFGYSEDSVEKKIVGLPERVTSDMLKAHYLNMGLVISIVNTGSQAEKYVGTGDKVLFGEDEYSVILRGDTTGDGVIDIFDLYSILDHINSVNLLKDDYYKAGCVCLNDDIDIFDFYSELDYINTGVFTE